MAEVQEENIDLDQLKEDGIVPRVTLTDVIEAAKIEIPKLTAAKAEVTDGARAGMVAAEQKMAEVQEENIDLDQLKEDRRVARVTLTDVIELRLIDAKVTDGAREGRVDAELDRYEARISDTLRMREVITNARAGMVEFQEGNIDLIQLKENVSVARAAEFDANTALKVASGRLRIARAANAAAKAEEEAAVAGVIIAHRAAREASMALITVTGKLLNG